MLLQSKSLGENPAKQDKKKWFYLVIIVIIAIPYAFTEIYVRILYPHKDLMVETGRKIGPNPLGERCFIDAFSAYRSRPGSFSDTKTVNSHGFISTPEIKLQKPKNTTRIMFLGGSSTAGVAPDLPDEATWPWQTALLLRKKFKDRKIEFINAAQPGYTTFESFGVLWSRIRFFSPDVVVLYQGWNEMYYFDDVDTITRWRTLNDGSWTFNRTKGLVTRYAPSVFDYLIWPSQALTYVRLGLSESVKGEVSNSKILKKSYDTRGLDIFRGNLRIIREICDLIGTRLYVAKQATLIVKDLPPEVREHMRYDLHGFGHDAHIDAFEQLYRIIEEEIEPENILDLTPLSGNPRYFVDHVHHTILGARKTAEIVSANVSLGTN